MSNNQRDQSVLNLAQLIAIQKNDLDDVANFLHLHMNDRFAPQEWKQGISRLWLTDVPNYGFMLKCDTQIVGVFCALYSKQYVGGSIKQFCNPHSWCVLPDFRKRSMELMLALVRQKDYTFTMFTPNKNNCEILKFLKFEPLDNNILILINMPSIKGTGSIINFHNIQKIGAHLPEQTLQHYQDHADFPWLNFLFYHYDDEYGFLIFKKQRYKKLGCARIIYVSDPVLFRKCWSSIGANLLFKHGLFTSKIEARLLDKPMNTWFEPELGTQKFFLSNELSTEYILNLYSELVSLDI